jgi:hypothetical protein
MALDASRGTVVLVMRTFGVLALVGFLTGCGGGSGSSSTPTAASGILVTVDYAGAPLSGVKVTLSNGLNNQTPTGVIQTASTNASGQVTFTSLPSSGTVCISATETTNAGTSFSGNCVTSPFPADDTLSLDS